MSNFQCPHCGMTNIDCGKDGYKTPKEIELEQENEKLKKQISKQANAKIQLKNLDSRFAQDYCVVKQKLENIKKLVVKKTKSEETIYSWEILQIIESEE